MSVEADTTVPVPSGPWIVHAANKVARTILGLFLLGMVIVNVVNALCRYVFSIVFTGADELLVFSMIWMVMVGLILVTAERRNISLDFMVVRAGPRFKAALFAIHHAAMTVACAYAAYYCWAFVGRVASIGQTSMALGLPMAIPHAALFVGMLGTAAVSALLLVADIASLTHAPRTRKSIAP
jgi:TRAP-type transport system small permease protein